MAKTDPVIAVFESIIKGVTMSNGIPAVAHIDDDFLCLSGLEPASHKGEVPPSGTTTHLKNQLALYVGTSNVSITEKKEGNAIILGLKIPLSQLDNDTLESITKAVGSIRSKILPDVASWLAAYRTQGLPRHER